MYVEKLIELSKKRSVHGYTETKFHIQKYDGFENIEKRSCALEVTLGSQIF